MGKTAPTYYVRLAVQVALLVLVWQQEHKPLALLVTMISISIEAGHARVRQMHQFIMTRAHMPPITGGPHDHSKQPSNQNGC